MGFQKAHTPHPPASATQSEMHFSSLFFSYFPLRFRLAALYTSNANRVTRFAEKGYEFVRKSDPHRYRNDGFLLFLRRNRRQSTSWWTRKACKVCESMLVHNLFCFCNRLLYIEVYY